MGDIQGCNTVEEVIKYNEEIEITIPKKSLSGLKNNEQGKEENDYDMIKKQMKMYSTMSKAEGNKPKEIKFGWNLQFGSGIPIINERDKILEIMDDRVSISQFQFHEDIKMKLDSYIPFLMAILGGGFIHMERKFTRLTLNFVNKALANKSDKAAMEILKDLCSDQQWEVASKLKHAMVKLKSAMSEEWERVKKTIPWIENGVGRVNKAVNNVLLQSTMISKSLETDNDFKELLRKINEYVHQKLIMDRFKSYPLNIEELIRKTKAAWRYEIMMVMTEANGSIQLKIMASLYDAMLIIDILKVIQIEKSRKLVHRDSIEDKTSPQDKMMKEMIGDNTEGNIIFDEVENLIANKVNDSNKDLRKEVDGMSMKIDKLFEAMNKGNMNLTKKRSGSQRDHLNDVMSWDKRLKIDKNESTDGSEGNTVERNNGNKDLFGVGIDTMKIESSYDSHDYNVSTEWTCDKTSWNADLQGKLARKAKWKRWPRERMERILLPKRECNPLEFIEDSTPIEANNEIDETYINEKRKNRILNVNNETNNNNKNIKHGINRIEENMIIRKERKVNYSQLTFELENNETICFNRGFLRKATRKQIWKKVKGDRRKLETVLWLRRPANGWRNSIQHEVFHDLTAKETIKIKGIGSLLALGANFAIRPAVTKQGEVKLQTNRCIRRLILKDYFWKPEMPFPLGFKSKSSWYPNSRLKGILERIELPKVVPNMDVSLNLTRRQKQTLRELTERTDLKVVLADKNLGLCLIEKEEYYKRMKCEINLTPQSFGNIEHSETMHHTLQRKLINKMSEILFQYCLHPLAKNIIKYIRTPMLEKMISSEVMGLPKLHKEGKRMRLVFPMSKHPFGPIHRLLATALKHKAFQYSSILFHVLEFVRNCIGKSYHKDSMIFKADIATFYPSVKMEDVCKTVYDILDKEMLEFIRTKEAWIELIKLAHWKLEFKFQEKLFSQEDGLPIGSPSAPILAILTLHHHLKNNYDETKKKLKANYLGIYFDDLIGIAECNDMENIKGTITKWLEEDSSFKIDEKSWEGISMRELIDKPIEFLDIEMYAVEDEENENMVKLCCRPYCKKLGAHQYVPWNSAHSPSVKKSLVHTELCRRVRLCTRINDWQTTTDDLKIKLIRRGYPEKFLMDLTKRFEWDGIHERREKTTEKILKARSPRFAWSLDKIPPSLNITIPLIIRYDPRIFNAMKEYRKILEQEIRQRLEKNRMELRFEFRIVIAYSMGAKLLDTLSKPNKQLVNIHSRTLDHYFKKRNE